MKIKIKQLIPIFISISIYILLLFLSINEFYSSRPYDLDDYNFHYRLCKEENNIQSCEIVALGKPVGKDAVTLYFDFTVQYTLYYLALLGPLMVIIPSLWKLHKELKNGFYKNILTRKKYKDYIKDNYIKSLKYALLIPILLIITFIICLMLTKNLDNSDVLRDFVSFWGHKYFLTNPMISAICYLLTFVFHGIFYVNLSYLYIKKNLHISVTILASWLTFIACEIISEVFIGGLILYKLFNVPYAMHYFSLINIYTYENIDKFWIVPIYGFILALLSSIVIYFQMRNKEEVYIENDK